MRHFLIALIALIALIVSPLALANDQHQTAVSTIAISSGGPHSGTPFTPAFIKFDQTLGTLNAVTYTFATSTSVNFSGQWQGQNVNNYTLTMSTTDTLNLGGQTTNYSDADQKIVSLVNGTVYPSLSFSDGGAQGISATNLAPFIGTGVVTPATYNQTISFSGFGSFAFPLYTGTATCTVDLDYNYTPSSVPEVGTGTALGMITGMLMLAGVARKRLA